MRTADVPLPGGETTIADRTADAYSFPASNLGEETLEVHLEGDVAFEAEFVSPPATVNAGLGPLFGNSACAGCHVRDGRGLPKVGAASPTSSLIVRVSATQGIPVHPNAPVPVPGLGTQIQDHATFGNVPDGAVRLEWIEEPGAYADGEPFRLRRPVLYLSLPSGAPLADDVAVSIRVAPPVFGLGLLEAIEEADVLAHADPDDADGDGISGRANRVWQVERAEAVLGRFGWKANVPDLRQQAAAAYAEDMGVSSSVFPEGNGTFELPERTLRAVTLYTQTLAVPQRTATTVSLVRKGEALFADAGCASCHVEEYTTGVHELAELSRQTIRPYTDLLLHNMGFDLADGRPDYLASGTEWRTPALWGVGLAQTVLPDAGFLHDGRARNLAEALLWHGGEAEESKEAFRNMRASDRAALLAFLSSL